MSLLFHWMKFLKHVLLLDNSYAPENYYKYAAISILYIDVLSLYLVIPLGEFHRVKMSAYIIKLFSVKDKSIYILIIVKYNLFNTIVNLILNHSNSYCAMLLHT